MIAACPVCRSVEREPIVRLEALPVLINAQVSPSEAPTVSRGDIELVACCRCAHLYNAAFDEARLGYDAAYENTLHFSEHFRQYATALAKRLVEAHGLRGGRVGELGSGPGHFLSLLCEAGVGEGLGWDPSFDPDRLGAPEHPAVQVSTDRFPDDGSVPMDLAVSQHVLEHLSEPVGALVAQRAAVEARGGSVYTEVPNGELMVRDVALWDLIYEHLSYFVPTSITTACRRAGLLVDTIDADYGGQFLWCESRPTEPEPDWLPDDAEPTLDLARAFGRAVAGRIDEARELVADRSSAGPVALWGAGSKGMTFLNLVAQAGAIAAVVDINPRKLGAGVPGTHHTIVGPEHLADIAPSTVLASNPAYVAEIETELAALGVDAEVVPLWQ